MKQVQILWLLINVLLDYFPMVVVSHSPSFLRLMRDISRENLTEMKSVDPAFKVSGSFGTYFLVGFCTRFFDISGLALVFFCFSIPDMILPLIFKVAALILIWTCSNWLYFLWFSWSSLVFYPWCLCFWFPPLASSHPYLNSWFSVLYV